MLTTLIWIIITCVVITPGQKLMSVENVHSTENVVIEENFRPMRHRRSADISFPATLQLKFTLNGDDSVDIVLARRHLQSIPSINGKKYKDVLQNHAIYQNPLEGAAITMRCRKKHETPCQLYGTFNHRGKTYQIQALSYGAENLYEVVRLDIENRTFLGLRTSEQIKTTVQRRKRYAGDDVIQTNYVAEMLLWIDYVIYNRFLDTAGGDEAEVDLNIETFAIGIMNEVDTRARNLQIQAVELNVSNAADFDLSVMLTELVVCKTTDFCIWSESPDYNNNGVLQTNALLAFIATLILYQKTNYDFAVGLTGYEVLDDRHPDTNCGVYFLDNQMCVAENLTFVSSVTKATEGGVGFNVAHFLGRHIGMIADSSDPNCAEDNYLSSSDWSSGSPDKASHPFRWSTCTINRVYASTQTLGKNDCLLDNNFVNATYLDYHSALEPGRELDADTQCKYAFGSSSVFCGTQNASLCYVGLSCTNPGTSVCGNVALPLDGTACNELTQPLPKKMCDQGSCVEIITTTTTTPTTTTTTTPTTTTTTPTTTTTTTPTTTTTTPTTTTTTPTTTTTTTPTTTTTTPTTTTTTPTTTTTTPTTTTTTPTTTTTTPTTTTTTTPTTTTTTTPTTTTTTPTTTTTTPTTTTTTPTTTTTTPTTTTTTTPTTTTTTPTTTTTTPITTTTTPTTTTTTPTTTTTTPTTTTTTPTTATTTPTTTSTTTSTTPPTPTISISSASTPRPSATTSPISSTTKRPKTRSSTLSPKTTSFKPVTTSTATKSQSSTKKPASPKSTYSTPVPTTQVTTPYSSTTVLPQNFPVFVTSTSNTLFSASVGRYTQTKVVY